MGSYTAILDSFLRKLGRKAAEGKRVSPYTRVKAIRMIEQFQFKMQELP